MNRFELTVIVPFYNEENTLQTAVFNLLNENFASEILLIDDGSSDLSNEIARELAKKFSEVRLVESQENIGKGHAVRLGINNATKKYIGVLDADLEYLPTDLKNLYFKISENELDIVCGSRFIGNYKRDNLYFRTYLANKFLSKLFSIIYKKKVTDVATCLKVFKKDIVDQIELESNGFEIEVELLAKILIRFNKYEEIPIKYFARSYEEGKKIKLIDGLRYLFIMFKFR